VVASGVQVAVATRPHPTSAVNGDAWFADLQGPCARLAVVDGAGHGEAAHAASQLVIDYLREHPAAGLVQTLQDCHRLLHGTRGAVMTLAHISPERGEIEVAGVGNVDMRLRADGKQTHIVTQRGILGYTLPTIRPQRLVLPANWLLVMYSDGIQSRFTLEDAALLELASSCIQGLADALLARYERAEDDSTVLVATSG
jgi:serine phosphatase RsbU (regulator of sigma subunit)